MASHEVFVKRRTSSQDSLEEKLICSEKTNDQHAKNYNIVEDEHDTRTLPLDSTPGYTIHVALIAAWACYLTQRLRSCYMKGSYVEWLVLFCELILASSDFLPILELSMLLLPRPSLRRTPICRMVGPTAPMIHVLVTTCGEDIEIAMDTITGAAIQDYPSGCHQVFVLDDAGSSELCQAVQTFNSSKCTALPVVYLRREKRPGLPHHYKAGNLRYGIAMTHEHFGGSEYIAALDVDMIPERDWLSRTVPHLIRSPELAMVNPPQLSYDCPDTDALAQDTNVFAQVLGRQLNFRPEHFKSRTY